jgi:hypothetical protein
MRVSVMINVGRMSRRRYPPCAYECYLCLTMLRSSHAADNAALIRPTKNICL